MYFWEQIQKTKLNNFVFKYINAFEISGFQEYKVMNNDPKIKIQKSGKNLKVTFNPIDFSNSKKNDSTITYTVKVLKKKDELVDENINMIAISESNLEAKKHLGSTSDKNPITVELNNIEDNFKSVQVIATIIQGPIIEYVSYQAVDSTGKEIIDPDPVKIDNKDESKPKDDNDNKTTLYIIIGVISFVVVAVIVVVVIVLVNKSKNKDLLNNVNKISFVQSDAEAKDDSNLLMDNNKNELD